MKFSRPEYWNEYPFPSPGIFPTQGSNPGLPYCRRILNQLSHQGSLCGHRRAKRSYFTFKVRRGGCEGIPLIQGKEQRLRFAGAAVKR